MIIFRKKADPAVSDGKTAPDHEEPLGKAAQDGKAPAAERPRRRTRKADEDQTLL